MSEDRAVYVIKGPDAEDFLQGLVTNDVTRVSDGLVYAAMLTPQGKYIADFLLASHPDGFLLDVAKEISDNLVRRLSMYKLRAQAEIVPSELQVHRGLGATPSDAFADPRHADLGWRAYRNEAPTADDIDWAALYVSLGIPQTGVELHGDSYILEAGFERLNGVDFRKGCYVGQEVTARMKHKTELRKGLARVGLEGSATPGDEITANGKVVGTVHSVAGDQAIAYLRFDRAKGVMETEGAKVTLLK